MTAALALAVAGCDGLLPTGTDSGTPLFVQEIELTDFEEIVGEGPVRVEVRLLPGGLTASQVVLHAGEDFIQESESIEGRAIAVQAGGDTGTLTLALDGLRVSFDAETQFRLEEDELGFDGFVTHMQERFALGHEPAVTVKRAAPDLPQDPGEAEFAAALIRLGGEAGEPEISLNVDADNLELNEIPAADEPDAWLTLLGLRIQLRVTEGITSIEMEDHDFADETEFEGQVASVSLEAGSFTLTDGRVVRIVDQTEIVAHRDHDPATLAGVAEALEAHHEVVAWGHGGIEGEDPLTIVAVRVVFSIIDDEPSMVEFEGHVASVDLEAGSFALTDGTIVRILDATEVRGHGDGDPATLGGLAEALEAETTVIAWGHGELAAEEPPVIDALDITFAIVDDDSGSDGTEFEGHVASVRLQESDFTLGSGTVIRIVEETEMLAGDDHGLSSLEAVVEALEDGHDVIAWGHGAVEGEEPLSILAAKVTFAVAAGAE